MRYHLGLGIGHKYGHSSYAARHHYGSSPSVPPVPASSQGPDQPLDHNSDEDEPSSSDDTNPSSLGRDGEISDEDDLPQENLSDIDEGELYVADMYTT